MVKVIKPADRDRPASVQSPGMLREAAICGSLTGAEGLWMGVGSNDPGNASLRESLQEICAAKGAFNVRRLWNFMGGKAKREGDGRRIEGIDKRTGAIPCGVTAG